MKAGFVFLFPVVLGSMTLLAQSSAQHDSHPSVASVGSVSMDCPIDMRAQRQSGVGAVVPTADRNKGPVQELAFTLKNSTPKEIVDLQITVHGINSKGRVSPLKTSSADSSQIQKSLDLKLKIGPESRTSTTLVLPGFTAVRSIELDSVNYAGGSSWRSSTVHSCHIYPDATMLISKR